MKQITKIDAETRLAVLDLIQRREEVLVCGKLDAQEQQEYRAELVSLYACLGEMDR